MPGTRPWVPCLMRRGVRKMRVVVFENYVELRVPSRVAKPRPEPGEVLLRVAGSGACHSDIIVYQFCEKGDPVAHESPFVLGHENVGWVEELGPGVSERVQV